MIQKLNQVFLEFSENLKMKFESYNESLKSEEKGGKKGTEEDEMEEMDEFQGINLNSKLMQ